MKKTVVLRRIKAEDCYLVIEWDNKLRPAEIEQIVNEHEGGIDTGDVLERDGEVVATCLLYTDGWEDIDDDWHLSSIRPMKIIV